MLVSNKQYLHQRVAEHKAPFSSNPLKAYRHEMALWQCQCAPTRL